MSDETSTTRVTEFEDGSQIVTTETVATEYVEPGATSELATEIAAEAGEVPDSDAVRIAEINADRDITLAAIQSETTTAIVEAETDKGDDEWRQNMQAQLTGLQSTVETLAALLTPPQSEEPPASQQESPEPVSGEVTPDSPAVPEAAAEPPKRPKRSRWI